MWCWSQTWRSSAAPARCLWTEASLTRCSAVPSPWITHHNEDSLTLCSFTLVPLQVDVVVFATGYDYSFPFLPPDLQAKSGYRLRLYKHMFPPTLTRPTLAVVGFANGFGAINPLAEMQGRLATRVFKGKVLRINVTHMLLLSLEQFSSCIQLNDRLILHLVLFLKGNPSVHTNSNMNWFHTWFLLIRRVCICRRLFCTDLHFSNYSQTL